jgi:hypothetical protein
MEKLHQQVRKACGRMNLQTFVSILSWSIFAWLLAAAIALAVPKIWVLGWSQSTAQTYTWSIIGGALALGFITAGVWTWLRRRNELDAAIELDHRYGLKERVSSTLALTPEELNSEAGQALLTDAVRRVERIDVRERFGVKTSWWAALPLAPALAVFALVLISNATSPEETAAAARTVEIKKQVKATEENLKKPLEQLRKEAEEKGLEEAETLFKDLKQGLDGLHEKAEGDKKKAMVQLNNLADQLKQREQRLKDSEEIKNQMNNLKDIKQGPADKVAKALKEGDLQQAIDEMKNLQDKLKQDGLNADEQKKLEEQLKQMQEKLQQVADAHQQAKQDLQQQIDQAKQQGDLAQAGKLQQKLDQLGQQQQAMDKLQQMADQLGQAAQKMQAGDQQGAAQQLEQIADQLGEMQNMEQELQMLEEAQQQIAQAKEAMNCKECQGEGCEACQGQGMGQFGQGRQKNGKPGRGMGEGQGRGDRPEEENQTGGYDSQVRGKVGPGEAVIVGQTGGPNKAGDAREQINSAIRSAVEGAANPLTNQRLPRSQRDHVKEYYDGLRTGK